MYSETRINHFPGGTDVSTWMWLPCPGVDFTDRKHSQVAFESNRLTVKTKDNRGQEFRIGRDSESMQFMRRESKWVRGATPYKGFWNSVNFVVVKPKPAAAHCARPVILAKPGHRGEKQGQGRRREKHWHKGSGKGSMLVRSWRSRSPEFYPTVENWWFWSCKDFFNQKGVSCFGHWLAFHLDALSFFHITASIILLQGPSQGTIPNTVFCAKEVVLS